VTRRALQVVGHRPVVLVTQIVLDHAGHHFGIADGHYLLHERFMMIAAGTGARRNEVALAPWAAVDFESGYLAVRKSARADVKERQEKNIPLPDYLLEYLNYQRNAYPKEVWLLDDGHGKIAYKDTHSITTAMRRHMVSVGMGGLGIKPTHGFRALYATQLRNILGVDTQTISGLLGHSQISTTLGYFSGEEEKKKMAVGLVRMKLPRKLSR